MTGAAVLYAGNGDCDAVYYLNKPNHNGKALEFDVVMAWFLAAKEDVLVSPAHARSFPPAYSCPLTHACVFYSSFAHIL